MINFIYGRTASAKLEHISKMIADDNKNKILSFLIVPEQFSVHSERHMLRALPPSAQLTLEVLNFSRLYDRVCREYGGIEYNYAKKPVKYAMMWQNLRELRPFLSVYDKNLSTDTSSLCDIMLAATGEFKSCGIKPHELESVAKKLGDTPLAKKLNDLSLIYASYNGLIENSFSDSSDDISKLYDKLLEHDFFAGTNVYIDSFTSFTGVEHKIIERIFKTAANVTVSLPLEAPRDETLYNKSIIECEARLRRSAEKHGEINEIVLSATENQAEDIKYLAKNLWSSSKENIKDKSYVSNSVQLIKCSSPYTEAEAAAATVLSLLREGRRCRDIVVLMRDADAYRGIIEPAFDKCDIPYHFSEKTELSTTPIVKFILSALRIGIYNWKTSDVISHLKCSLYNLPDDDIDLFEQYVTTWQIRGDRFTSGEFTMKADGYVEEDSKRGEKIKAAANRVRDILSNSILTLLNDIENASDTAEKIRAIYTFLSRSGVEKKLEELSQKEKKNGNPRTAEEYSRIFGITCDALADLVKVIDGNDDFCSDLSLSDLCELLSVYFSKNEIGSIPSSADQVIIGSASMMRTGEPKCVLMLGMCEGVFPAPVNDSGVLSFSEKKLICESSFDTISFSGSLELASSDELMYVQRAVEAASEELYMFCYTASTDGRKTMPSLPFTIASRIFKNNVKHYSGKDLKNFTPSLSSSIQYLDKINDKELKAALRRCLSEDKKFSRLVSEKRSPISDVNCSVDAETAKKIFPDELYLSQSKINKFVKCNFSYYCTYVLKLREEHISRFKPSDIGTFIHYILEKLLAEVVTEDGVSPDLTDDKLNEMISTVVEDYINQISPAGTPRTARLSHLYQRLEKLSTLLVHNIIEEFKHSSFRPKFFELDTNGKENNPSPREFVLNDKQKVIFSGKIDRVDLLKKDGKVYIRVVDYKTGTKQFALEDIEYGLNVQMLLYLFTLINNKNEAFNHTLGSDDLNAAGILYLSSNDASNALSLSDYKKETEVFSEAQKGIERSGLLLENEDILLAMNDELSKDFLAGISKKIEKSKKKGETDEEKLTGDALTSAAKFALIEKDIERVIKRIAVEMTSGVANAIPLNYKKNDPCRYCTMKPICRRLDSAQRR